MQEPINDLERAYLNAHLGMAETVAYFNELRDSILIFLMPYHPEVEGVMQVSNGSSLTFELWKIGGEDMIPIFTSTYRVEEALRASGRWERKSMMAEMLGKELLHLISLMMDRNQVIVNPGCATGSRAMDAVMVNSILDGSALEIPTPGEMELNGLAMSLPNSPSQPARLREPLAKFFSGLPEVAAAWLFHEDEPTKPFEYVYVVGILVEGGDAAAVKLETALAIAGACPPEWNSRVWVMDRNDSGLADIFASLPPFYKTPAFQPPAKVKPVTGQTGGGA